MSQRQYLYVDNTNRAIQFSQNDWVFTSQASRDLGLRGVFKDTLAATVVTGATIRIEFQGGHAYGRFSGRASLAHRSTI